MPKPSLSIPQSCQTFSATFPKISLECVQYNAPGIILDSIWYIFYNLNESTLNLYLILSVRTDAIYKCTGTRRLGIEEWELLMEE